MCPEPTQTRLMLPKPPIPEPLRGSETGSFAHNTIIVRLPDIARRVLAENTFPQSVVANLQALIEEMPAGLMRPLKDAQAPDTVSWRGYVAHYIGKNWLQVPWFFAETYFYRRILEATGYFQSGAGQGADPFMVQKHQGLEMSQRPIRAVGAQLNLTLEKVSKSGRKQAALTRFIKMSLWGNQADLSIWPAGQVEHPDHLDSRSSSRSQRSHLLVDDAAKVAARLLKSGIHPVRVDFILDNAGLELVNDLALADFLLSAKIATSIRVHLKAHPTFVSDAMIKDIQQTVDVLASDPHPDVRSLAERLKSHLEDGRLHLQEDYYWNSPLSMWEMPSALRQELSGSDLILIKGDANYRRLLGDRRWSYTTPFDDVAGYMPSPSVALRVLKSEVVVGLGMGQPEALDRKDPGWMFSGKWGMIQFVET